MAEFAGVGVTRLLEAIRTVDPSVRFYQAPRSRCTATSARCHKRSARRSIRARRTAWRKVYRHFITVNYRESYGLHACSGILFNHESPRRGLEFVTRKITDGVARIKLGLADELRLGDLVARHDWSFAGGRGLRARDAGDAPAGAAAAIRGPHRVEHPVHDFVEIAFDHAGLDAEPYVVSDPSCRGRLRSTASSPIRAAPGRSSAGSRKPRSRSSSG